jgi:hypothetical protein
MPDRVKAVAGAHARVDRFLGASDRCLPRAVALRLDLARRGIRSQMLIGVRGAPFAAHAWVQHGELLINDECELVRIFSPIVAA